MSALPLHFRFLSNNSAAYRGLTVVCKFFVVLRILGSLCTSVIKLIDTQFIKMSVTPLSMNLQLLFKGTGCLAKVFRYNGSFRYILMGRYFFWRQFGLSDKVFRDADKREMIKILICILYLSSVKRKRVLVCCLSYGGDRNTNVKKHISILFELRWTILLILRISKVLKIEFKKYVFYKPINFQLLQISKLKESWWERISVY